MSAPWGCHSKPREDGYLVKNGYCVRDCVLIQLVKYHKDTSTVNCQYRKDAPDDPRCQGCTSP